MNIVLFDINRLTFSGGAEKYFFEIGEEFAQKNDRVYFLGDCRIILKFYILLSVILQVNPIWKIPQLFAELNNSSPLPYKKNDNFSHVPLSFLSLIFFSKQRKKIKEILIESDLILIKNELIDVLFYLLLGVKNKNQFLVIFSSIKYPLAKTMRSRLHNLIYLSNFYRYLIKKIGRVIVSNKEDENYFTKTIFRDKKNVFYIPYGLEKKYFAQNGEIKASKDFKILFVGRMEEQKGILYLKKIVEDIDNDKKTKTISFCLIGSGPLEGIPRLLGEKYKNVDFKGQLSSTAVRKYYLESDLVVITSLWETFSYVCLEAQACGAPIVSFDIPGPRDILEKNTGDLIPVGEINLFKQSMLKYFKMKMNNPEKYLRFRKQIVDITKTKFSLEKTTKQIKLLING